MSELNESKVENEKLENNNISEEEKAVEAVLDTESETAEQAKENEDAYDEALAKLNSYGLTWTFRSIRYVIDKENISFSQLRSCVYMQGDRGVFDFLKSTVTLIKAGLVGSKQLDDTLDKELTLKAYDIIEDWRMNIGSVSILHLLIINQMETKHFFMGSTDMKILRHLSSKNLQKDLAANIVSQDLQEKMAQAQALAKSF